MSPRIAFFDVGETLITTKSMFSFLRFHFGQPRADVVLDRLASLAASGVPREETNRLYYGTFAGERADDVAESGRRWFARELATGTLFNPDVVAEFGRCQAEGMRTALVSGSFTACLAPIARHLGADHVLCTTPAIVDGRYTGDVLRTVIGAGKATVACGLMERLQVRPEECVAYGDHASDLPLLLAVGDARVVGGDPVLRDHATRFGWPRLPGVPELVTLEE